MKQFLPYIIIWLIAVNLFACGITVFDKLRAIRGGRRVREATLLLVSALGGGVGMFITMCLVRHKTRKKKFMLGIPLILVLQVAAYVIWRGYFA